MARFDLSPLPANIKINWARMRFYTELWAEPEWPAEGASFAPIGIFNNLGDWSETNVTWNTAPPFDGVAVQIQDHFGLTNFNEEVYFTGTNVVFLGAETNTPPESRWLEFAEPSTWNLVQGWVDGTVPNHGVAVKGTGDYLGWGTGDRLFWLQTKENTNNPTWQPMLIVDYELVDPPTNAVENLILGASDDSWVDGNQPSWGINHGAEDVMRVRHDNQPSDWGQNHSLVKFDLSAFSGQLIDLKSAKIRINTGSLISWPGLTNFTPVAMFNNTGSWDESTVTWNNAPAREATAVETLDHFSAAFGGDDVFFTGTNGITSGGWLEYESSNTMAMVDGWINGTIPNHGVTIMGVTNVDAYRVFGLTTKENSADGARPQLVLEYDIVGFYGYDSWADSYGGTGVIGSVENDYEPDGLDNLLEYAFGGNPTNADAAAVSPTIAGGTDIVHVYRRRVPSELSYELFVDTDFNLITYGWTNAAVYGAVESSAPAADPGFLEVTTTFTGAGDAVDQVFLKLEVTK
ncbi:MAG: hypothetical protein DRP64_16355 [Verrucomicrobia bacterium]|nr:MAG: hypothetical protein DRP64_16355 [Verrucomicrobiota bacterium]